MVVDKKHEPINCWSSDKTYSILSVKKVLIQGIIYCTCMLMYCVVVCIVYYLPGEDFFPRFLTLSNSYQLAVTMVLLNHPSVFWGRINFFSPLAAHWCTKIACMLCFITLRIYLSKGQVRLMTYLSTDQNHLPRASGQHFCRTLHVHVMYIKMNYMGSYTSK